MTVSLSLKPGGKLSSWLSRQLPPLLMKQSHEHESLTESVSHKSDVLETCGIFLFQVQKQCISHGLISIFGILTSLSRPSTATSYAHTQGHTSGLLLEQVFMPLCMFSHTVQRFPLCVSYSGSAPASLRPAVWLVSSQMPEPAPLTATEQLR